MKEPIFFEVPSPHEKLSFKFILDDLRQNEIATHPAEIPEAPDTELAKKEPIEVEKQIENCGALADPIELEASNVLGSVALPEGKKYFRIGEVSELLKVEPYILRYWESEFRSIRPMKTGAGHRVYSRKDVETLIQIRHLLYVEKFSLKGAKKKLTEKRTESTTHVENQKDPRFLKELAGDLKDLIHALKTNPGNL